MVNFKKGVDLQYKDVEKCVLYLLEKGIEIDDAKLHHEIVDLRKFLATKIDDDKFYIEQCVSSRMCQFFAAN